jgi:hypothetical protein
MSDAEVTSGLGELRDRVGRLEVGLAENTAATRRIEASALRNELDTSEMLDLFRSARGGFKVLGHVGSLIKWAAAVGASLVALYFTLKGK